VGGRGGFEPGGGMPGEQFSGIVRAVAAAEDFELNSLQQQILDAAIDNDIITRSEFEAILRDGEMTLRAAIHELETLLKEALKSVPSHRIHSKFHTKVLKDAITFWKRHHGGKIPADAVAWFADPEIVAAYFSGGRNFTLTEWSHLTSPLGDFGRWLDRVFANFIVGLPMPSDF